MTLRCTYTRTHLLTGLANPYLICDPAAGGCGAPVAAFHDPDACGCRPEGGFWNDPCGCAPSGVTSVCPSWGPGGGCTCEPTCEVGRLKGKL